MPSLQPRNACEMRGTMRLVTFRYYVSSAHKLVQLELVEHHPTAWRAQQGIPINLLGAQHVFPYVQMASMSHLAESHATLHVKHAQLGPTRIEMSVTRGITRILWVNSDWYETKHVKVDPLVQILTASSVTRGITTILWDQSDWYATKLVKADPLGLIRTASSVTRVITGNSQDRLLIYV